MAYEGILNPLITAQNVLAEAEKYYILARTHLMDHLLELRDASHVSLGKFSKNKTTRKDNEDSALLKINLTIFDGDVTKWEEFRDLFKSLVHDVDRIPSIKKMQ